MQPIIRLISVGFLLCVATIIAHAAPEDVTIPPEFADKFILYADIDKRDREPAVIRSMYINPLIAYLGELGKPLPLGTQIVMVEHVAETGDNGEIKRNGDGRMIATDEVYRIIVSRKRYGTDAEYDESKRIGDWEFGVFEGDGNRWPTDIDFDECRECHKKASQTDYTFSVFRNIEKIRSSRGTR